MLIHKTIFCTQEQGHMRIKKIFLKRSPVSIKARIRVVLGQSLIRECGVEPLSM